MLDHYAYSLIQSGRPSEALRIAESYDPAFRTSVDAWYQYGWLLEEAGRTADALHAYDKALERDPVSARIHFARGVCLERLLRMQEAADAYERARRHDPSHALAWANLGRIRAIQADTAEALRCQERAYQLLPDSINARNLSATLAAAGRYDDAERILRAALAEDPASVDVRLDLASALLEMDKISEVSQLISPAVRARPTDPRILGVVSLMHLLRGESDEAVRVANLAIHHNADSAPAHASLGMVLLRIGNEAGALLALDTAVQLDPEDPEIAAWHAAALAAVGRQREALAAFEHALKRSPRILSSSDELRRYYQQAHRTSQDG